jgi:hypothetical protein
MADTDNPWKQALDELFPLGMAFFLPAAAARVDWTRDYEPRETELQPLLPDTQTGLKYVDKLVKLWRRVTAEGETLKAGAEEEGYYHFEVQYRKEDGFEKRMSDYNDVARVHLHHHVVGVAILGDEDTTWRPEVYHWVEDDCELTFKFRSIKLLDWRGKEQELFSHDNPFALFVLAHLLGLPTEDDEEARAGWKLRLWQRACEHKMEEQDRNTLLRLLDWMLLLPQDRNRALLQQFSAWREGNPMPFISVFEQEILDQKREILDQKREILDQKQEILDQKQKLLDQDQQLLDKEQEIRDKEQKIRDGYLDGIALGLKLKFKEQGQALLAEVQKQTDLEWLRRFLKSIESTDSLDALRELLP